MKEGALHELPGGWVWTTLLEACKYLPTGILEYDGKIEYYSTGSIVDTSCNSEGLYSFSERPSRANRMADIGDVFQARMADTNKALLIGKELDRKLFSTGFLQLRPFNCCKDMSYYIYYYVQSPYFLRQKDKHATGSTQVALTDSGVKNITFPIAPLPEQRAIVSKIERLFSDLDNGIENFKKAQAQLKLYRQSVLKAACEGKLVPTEAEVARAEGRDYEAADVLLACIKEERKNNTRGKYIEMPTLDISDLPQLPEGWLWVQAQEVCNWITKGSTPKANKMFQGKGEIPFIKVYNLTNNGELNFSINPTFINKETHTKELSRSIVFPGDILMNIVGPPLGKISIVPDIFPEWNINQAIVIYRLLEGYDRKFLLYSLLTNNILSWAIKRSKATAGQNNLTIAICGNLPLPLPPLDEQRRIVAEVERRLSLCDKMEATITESLHKAESLRQSILKKAFEGKLLNIKELEKARNAYDWEPAEKLLERIKAEKVKAQKNTLRSKE